MYFAGALAVVLNFTWTAAWSLAETRGPVGGLPDAVAMFVKSRLTFVSVQVYDRDEPGASVPRLLRAQFGAIGSSTLTAVRRTLPLFVTVIVKLAVP